MSIKILSAWGEEMNPFADPETANNGGGYLQPSGGVVAEVNGLTVKVELSDTSCGDFGRRVHYVIECPERGETWYYADDTMSNDELLEEDNEDALRGMQDVLGVGYELIRAAYKAVHKAVYSR